MSQYFDNLPDYEWRSEVPRELVELLNAKHGDAGDDFEREIAAMGETYRRLQAEMDALNDVFVAKFTPFAQKVRDTILTTYAADDKVEDYIEVAKDFFQDITSDFLGSEESELTFNVEDDVNLVHWTPSSC